MATAHRQPSIDVSTDQLPDDLPEVPDVWEPAVRDELPFGARAGWKHEETGQLVTIERNRKPTQMHTPETAKDDTGFNANVYRRDGTGRRYLSPELGAKVNAYEAAVRFMALYPNGRFEIAELDAWDEMNVDWRGKDDE